jgi:flagellar biosynthetic protein FlhB
MLRNVPNADVVVTNPTHYAVAMEFDPNSMEGPTVIAKGEDELAMRIRRLAEENKIPIREHPPLARALYGETEVGQVVPRLYWDVLVRVLGNVWNLERKRQQARNTSV